MKFEPRLVWLVALPAEARPLCQLFGLSPSTQSTPFPTYVSACGRELLVVSGLGRNLAAAAAMHAYHELGGGAHIAWLNVGIAGHGHHPLGSAWLVDQVVESSSGARFYPQPVVRYPFPLNPLTTVDVPQGTMADGSLYDMEASGFFQIASRLSSSELVSMVKIVSDHGVDQSSFPSRDQVSDWIKDHEAGLRQLADSMLALSAEESQRLEPIELDLATLSLHFTVTQQHQLRTICRRWNALGLAGSPLAKVSAYPTASDALKSLRQQVDGEIIDWTQNE